MGALELTTGNWVGKLFPLLVRGDPAIYAELIRTPSMERRMEALHGGGR